MRKRRYHKAPGSRQLKRSTDSTASSLLINGNNLSFKNKFNLSINNPVTPQDFFNNEDERVKPVRKRRKSFVSSVSSKKVRSNNYSECSEIENILTNSEQIIAREGEEKECDNISLADTVIGELSDDELDTFKDVIQINDIIPKNANINTKLIQSFSCIETTADNSLGTESTEIQIFRDSNLSNDSSSSSSGSCIFCLTKPKNAVFVHSKFVHLCSCYKCAVKIFNKSKRCPICNCAVKTVLQVFSH